LPKHRIGHDHDMYDDDDIRPIEPVRADRIEATERQLPVGRTRPVDDAVVSNARPQAQSSRTVPGSSSGVDPSIVHEQLEHPIGTPSDVRRAARIHDAARHGNPIAEAIERAHVASPSDRAQQLGGAASSAASGQSAQIDRHRDDELAHELDDPLTPVSRVRRGRNAANDRGSDDPD
jgi:hypothetical protein